MPKTKKTGAAKKTRLWELRQYAARPGVLELYIYGDVEGSYEDWWGEMHESDTSAEFFRDELARYPDVEQINIYINSYGGDVYEGTAIYNQLRRHPAKKTVYIDGFACSIASVIAMAGDEVIMPRNTLMMIHDMWQFCCGNARQLRKAADDLDTINAAGRQAYLAKAGDKLTEKRLIELMEAETWLTAEECLELGLCDTIAEEADTEKAARALAGVNDNLQMALERHRRIAAQLRDIFPAENAAREAEDAAPAPAEEPETPAPAQGKTPEPVQESPAPRARTLMEILAGV